MRHAPSASRIWLAQDGNGSIEFAFVALFLSTLALGVLDFGLGFWQAMQVQNAARAGAQYAIEHSDATASAIQAAVTGATSLSGLQATPAPTHSCFCPDAASGIAGATCGSSCSGGGTAQTYWAVSAQASYSTIFTWPGIPNPMTLTGTAYAQN